MDEIEEVDLMEDMQSREVDEYYEYFNRQYSPPSPPCYGFEPSDIPARLVIKTKIVDKEEVFESIARAKAGKRKTVQEQVDETLIVTEPRRSKDLDPAPVMRSSKPCVLTPKAGQGGTGSRPRYFLLESSLGGQFKYSKLPLTEAVLTVFLNNLESKGSKEAAADTRKELKKVWLHHFSVKLIQGKEFGIEDKEVEKNKMIKQDRFIDEKIIGVWKIWRKLEEDSRRPDRSASANFEKKVAEFKILMKKPFDICKVAAEDIIKNSGIKDWKEETEYLRNQLSEQQLGCPGSVDQNQKRRDQRLIGAQYRAEVFEKKKNEEAQDLSERKKVENEECKVADILDNNNNDADFIGPRVRRKKVDIMGKISLTSDRVNVSYQDRTMIAASTANALGVDLDNTNISKTTAWRKSKEIRSKTAASIKEAFVCPSKVTVHWDGKIVSLKGNIKSNRVCVYLTGVDADQDRKLLGVPETASGTGHDEAKVVTDMLVHWGVQEEVVGIVFDTTSSNTGAESGACKYIEDWKGSPVLWLACRHHVAELHMSRVVQAVTGNTKDSGLGLFRRLKRIGLS